MQLKTVQEGCPCSRTPTFGHLTAYCSPQVTLVHLLADAIPLGLCVNGQQVPQLLVRLGNCLVVSLLGFLEHLLGLLNLHLAGHNITLVETVSREPAASWRFFNTSDRFSTALVSTRHFLGSPVWLMTRRTATMCARYSSLFPRENIGIVLRGVMRQEAWSWVEVLPWAWRCQSQVHTEWAAGETAALSRT